MSYLRRRPAGVRTPKQRAGDAAEDAACTHLVEHGCRVLARNVRYREGELDVVAQDGPTVVFVEVRLRNRDTFGGAAGSVDQLVVTRPRDQMGLRPAVGNPLHAGRED